MYVDYLNVLNLLQTIHLDVRSNTKLTTCVWSCYQKVILIINQKRTPSPSSNSYYVTCNYDGIKSLLSICSKLSIIILPWSKHLSWFSQD